MATENTTVTKVEVNLDEILGVPGAEHITVPVQEKPNLFSRKKVDMTFIDNEEEQEEQEEENEETETPASEKKGGAAPAATEEEEEEETPAPSKKSGKEIIDEVANPAKKDKKAKEVKGGVNEAINSLIKAGKLIPFEDDKPIDQYNAKDIEELLEANFTERENKLRESVPSEFFSSLPEELQVAGKYVMDGGKDLRGLFRALAHVEEVHSLDVKDPKNHEAIVRQFLTATNFGTPEEIEEEVAGIKDREELEKKATQFKPKLDKMSESIVAQKLAQQEHMQKQQAEVAKAYVGSIYKVLESGDLNGIKLDRKTQNMLYSGLIQANYPSISGKQTNYLGHLLEKHQYVEPRHDLIAEALWLLADPDGYKAKLRDQGKNGNVEKVVRQLKTEQSSRTNPSSPIVEREETTQRRIPREHNFFKR